MTQTAWTVRRPIDALKTEVDLLATDPDPLNRLREAAHLQTAVDKAMRQFVDDARKAGAEWADIADALGLKTKQAAHFRYGRTH